MKIRGINDIIFDLDIKENDFYDLYADEKIVYRGIGGTEVKMRIKNIDTSNVVFVQDGSDIHLFNEAAKGFRYCPHCGMKLF